ncbi:MAG: GAF domain-containing sensor histidine kinase [Chloroflexi bacterium]|nr:GAF domain-containing sensor histidine kinase [Chloroflexota bacterium]
MEAIASGIAATAAPRLKKGRQSRGLLALRRLSQALSGLRDVEAVLEGALDTILQIVKGAAGGILLLDPRTKTLSYKAHRGLSPSIRDIRLGQGEGIAGVVVESGKPILLEDITKDRRTAYPDLVDREGLRAFMCVPLRSKGEVMGVLVIASHEPRQFTDNDLHLLTLIGDQVGQTIESARLYERLKRERERYRRLARQILVTQEEEQRRIARELHDETGQMLAGLALQLQVLVETAEKRGQDANLIGRLKELKSLAVQVHSEVNRVIARIRPAALDSVGLLTAVRQYAETSLRSLGIDVTVEASGAVRLLPIKIEAGLFRFTQGAIGNIAQHSKAKHAAIHLDYGEAKLSLKITDDGIGFDVSKIVGIEEDGRGLGVFSMKERIGILGGTCSIESRPGKGTTVMARIPIGGRGDDAEN